MPTKHFIDPHQFYIQSFKLAHKILKSNFNPDFIVALWRGGTPVGITVQEYLQYHNLDSDHIAIRTSLYNDINTRNKTIRIHGLDYLVNRVNPETRLLIVDDVFDTGLTLKNVIEKLKRKARKNTPQQIKTATLYFKRKMNQVDFIPDFYLEETEDWLIFPHELKGLSLEEVKAHKHKDIQEFFHE